MKRIIVTLSLSIITLCLGIAFANAQTAEKPDIMLYSSLERGIKCDFVKQVTALPEWKDFVDVFTAKIDAEYKKKESQPDFPKELANAVLDKVKSATGKSSVSSRDVFELYFKNVEGAQIKAWLTNPEKPEIVFAVLTKFDPAELESFLKFLPVQLNKSTEDGNTIYSGKDMGGDGFLGYTKVADRDSYVIALSGTLSRLKDQLKSAKTDGFKDTVFAQTGPFKQVSIEPSFIDKAREAVINEAKKLDDNNKDKKNLILVLEKIDSLTISTEDKSGATVCTLDLTTTDENVTKLVREMAGGAIAFVKFASMFTSDLDENGKKAIELISKIEIAQSGKTISAKFNFSNPALISLIKELLPKVAEEVKNK